MGFAASHGLVPLQAEAEYLASCQRHVAGAVDIQALHRGLVRPLACFTLAELAPWLARFEAEMAPRLPADMRALVERHRAAGDLCAIVTATTRLIAEPFARAFGVPHLVATEAVAVGSALTGEIAGEPCARQHKLARVEHWLAGQGSRLADFEQTWFYSDSAGDLPLLSAVSHPVVVRPDERLRLHAEQAGWPVL
jgi:HAD superfamily hydrolase (TIGR01490 family)